MHQTSAGPARNPNTPTTISKFCSQQHPHHTASQPHRYSEAVRALRPIEFTGRKTLATKSRIGGELARQFCSSFNARQETNSARPSISRSNQGDEILKAERTTASNSGSHPGSKGAKSPLGHTPVDLLYEKGIQRTLAKLLAELDPVEILGTVVYVVLSIWGKRSEERRVGKECRSR